MSTVIIMVSERIVQITISADVYGRCDPFRGIDVKSTVSKSYGSNE